MNDPMGSWSLSLQSVHRRGFPVRSAIKILMPLSTAPSIVQSLAEVIARSTRFVSGHGGLTFAYHPWHVDTAFNSIFAAAHRFWCVDVEDLGGTLSVDALKLKTVSWITMIGNALLGEQTSEPPIDPFALSAIDGVNVQRFVQGLVCVIGSEPITGDRNKPRSIPDAYFELAQELDALHLKHHPDFPGVHFGKDDNTMQWMRRFLDEKSNG